MKRTALKRKTPLGCPYDYTAFREGIRALDGLECWLRRLLRERSDQHPFDYSPGLLTCAGELDGHHLIRKNRLKQEFPLGVFWVDGWRKADHWDLIDEGPHRPLNELLEDSRNGVLVCRRHHDMLERGLIVIRRDELPARAREFAQEYGLEGWLDRYYPPLRSVS